MARSTPSVSRVLLWVRALRLPFLTASLLSVLLGTSVALWQGALFHWDLFLLALLGTACFHLGANLINDYFDEKNGSDRLNRERVAPFSGGSRVIQENLIPAAVILRASVICYLVGSGSGILLIIRCGWPVLWLGLLGLASGILYSAFPARLLVGELIVGLSFGTLVAAGSYFVQTGHVSPAVLLLSLPLSLLVTLILWVNEFPDYRADRDSGKTTLVVRLGRPLAAHVYLWLFVLVYALVAVLALGLGLFWLGSLWLTLPLAIRAIILVRRFPEHPRQMAPACPLTIQIHLVGGLLLTAAPLLKGQSLWPWPLLSLAAALGLILPGLRPQQKPRQAAHV